MVRLIIDLFQTGAVHLKHFSGLIFEDGKYIFIDAVPAKIVVTDVDDAKIARAKEVVSPEWAKEHGVELLYHPFVKRTPSIC